MKKILVPVHSGFEETELITTLDVLFRSDVDYYLWSIEGLNTVKSSHEGFVNTNPRFPTGIEFDGIFFHGGPGVEKMRKHNELYELVKSYYSQNKIVAAICAAPIILHTAGILENKTFTSHHSVNLEHSTQNEFEVDGNIITGRDYGATYNFAHALVEKVKR